jgi:hypothetical protein
MALHAIQALLVHKQVFVVLSSVWPSTQEVQFDDDSEQLRQFVSQGKL